MLNLKSISLAVGGSLFCASLFANWWLYRDAKYLQGALSLSKANEAVLLTTIETIKRQSEAADVATKNYVLSIQKLRREKDRMLAGMRAAKKNDSRYMDWSKAVLPSIIVNKYNGMLGKDDTTSSNQPSGSTASALD